MLLKNTLWNLLGTGIPIIAAVFTIPVIFKGLGTRPEAIEMAPHVHALRNGSVIVQNIQRADD